MSIIYNLIDYLIDEHKIFTNGFLVQYSAIVSENFHHTINDVHNEAGRNVIFSSCHKINTKFLGKEVIQTLDIL